MRKRRRLKRKVKHVLILALVLLIAISSGLTYAHKKEAANADTPEQTAQTTQTKTAKVSTNQQLQRNWQKVLNQTKSPVQIAVYDPSNNQTYTLTNQKQATFTTASTVKVAILAGILHNHQVAGTTLSSAEKQYAKTMIENSDNDAATTLFQTYLGGFDNLNQVFQDLKMTETSANDGWALTTTTATDQVKLLNAVFYHSTYLSTTSQNYIQQLMNNVQHDQQWGISAGSNTFQLKNGWRLDSDNTWIVNSIGHVGDSTKGYTIAILSSENKSLKYGQALVEKLARATTQVLSN